MATALPTKSHALSAPRKSAAPAQWRRFSPVFLHGLLVVLAVSIHWISDDPALTLNTVGILICFFYAILAYLEARASPLVFSPLSYHFAWYANALGLSAVYMAGRAESRQPVLFSVAVLRPEDIASATVLYLVGSFALHAGVQLMRPSAEPAETSRQTVFPDISAAGLFLLWATGLFSRLFAPSLAFLGSVMGLLQIASISALSIYALKHSERRNLWFWVLLSGGTLVEVIVNTRAGSKAYLMYSFLPILWVFAVRRSLRKWLVPLGIGMIGIYLTVVAPVVNASRNLHWSEGANQGERIARVFFDEQRQSADVGAQAEALLSRQFEPAPVAFLYREVERTGLRYGETLDYLAYAFIPRFFWPEKPNVTRGAWFTLYLGQARNEREVSTSTGQMAVGELYWNFGLGGVVLGMTILGVFMGALWRLCGNTPENDGLLMVLYLSLCMSMVDVAEAGTLLVSLVYRASVVGSAIWITRYTKTLLAWRSRRVAAR